MSETQAYQPIHGQPFSMMTQNATIVGIVKAHGSNAACTDGLDKRIPSSIDSRVRKTVRGVDAHGSGPGSFHSWDGFAIHLSTAQMFGVDRHVEKTVAANTIALSQPGRTRH